MVYTSHQTFINQHLLTLICPSRWLPTKLQFWVLMGAILIYKAVEGHRLTYMVNILITSGLLQEQNCSSASVKLVETAEVVLNRVLLGPMGQSTCTNNESR